MSNATATKTEHSRNSSRSQTNKEEELGDFETMVGEISDSVKDYGSKHPLAMAGAIFLAGFYLGWKVKPW